MKSQYGNGTDNDTENGTNHLFHSGQPGIRKRDFTIPAVSSSLR